MMILKAAGRAALAARTSPHLAGSANGFNAPVSKSSAPAVPRQQRLQIKYLRQPAVPAR